MSDPSETIPFPQVAESFCSIAVFRLEPSLLNKVPRSGFGLVVDLSTPTSHELNYPQAA